MSSAIITSQEEAEERLQKLSRLDNIERWKERPDLRSLAIAVITGLDRFKTHQLNNREREAVLAYFMDNTEVAFDKHLIMDEPEVNGEVLFPLDVLKAIGCAIVIVKNDGKESMMYRDRSSYGKKFKKKIEEFLTFYHLSIKKQFLNKNEKMTNEEFDLNFLKGEISL